jgi:hypothetical protein
VKKQGRALRLFCLRALTLVFGCLGLAWGILNLEQSAVAGDFWDVEAKLLRFETFSRAAAVRTLESPAAQTVSPCDSHSQRALLLMELTLAGADRQSGATPEFDRNVQGLEARTRQILSCTPRDSFAWLVAFGLEVAHGAINGRTFDLLVTSYETSPNEAWVALRRMIVAVPVALAAPERAQKMILDEFQNLIQHRFVEIPARAYFNASAATRALLQSRIEQLTPAGRKLFSEELEKLRS